MVKTEQWAFRAPKKISAPGDDGVAYRFPTAAGRSLIVRASGSRTAGLGLSETDLMKVLFREGLEELRSQATLGLPPGDVVVEINTKTRPHPLRGLGGGAPDPEGHVETLEVRYTSEHAEAPE